MTVPFLSFSPMHGEIRKEMAEAFQRVYDSNWYVLGKEVKAFEEAYAAFNNVKHCVGVSNGLDALNLSLKALNIQPGDEVIVPSNTYIATLLAVSYNQGTPVLVEPNPNTYNLAPENIEAALTEKTKAIMPVHLYGQCCEMTAIMEIADRHGIAVIEDNAQSQGATYDGKMAGSFGLMNGTSFYPGKNLGALGDAGAITTNDESLAASLRMYRNYGSEKKYYNEVVGYNMRLDELQAALLSQKLPHLNTWTSQRQEIASWYLTHLAGVGDLILPATADKATHVYHLFVIQTAQRDALQAHLQQKDIGTLIHYPIPPHLQKAYAHLGKQQGSYPIAEKLATQCLSLPLWPGMKVEEVQYVASEIKSFFNQH